AIDVVAFSWGEKQSGAFGRGGGGGGAGKVKMLDFHFVMLTNKASARLMLACACGEHLPRATLICRKARGKHQEYMKYTLTNVLVSKYTIGGPYRGLALPYEQVSLNFARVEVEYHEQKPDGSLGPRIACGYDAKTNQRV